MRRSGKTGNKVDEKVVMRGENTQRGNTGDLRTGVGRWKRRVAGKVGLG